MWWWRRRRGWWGRRRGGGWKPCWRLAKVPWQPPSRSEVSPDSALTPFVPGNQYDYGEDDLGDDGEDDLGDDLDNDSEDEILYLFLGLLSNTHHPTKSRRGLLKLNLIVIVMVMVSHLLIKYLEGQ